MALDLSLPLAAASAADLCTLTVFFRDTSISVVSRGGGNASLRSPHFRSEMSSARSPCGWRQRAKRH